MAPLYNVFKSDFRVTSIDRTKGIFIMLKKFNQYFNELISDRTEEIGQKILYHNKRYRELNLQIIEVQHALMENLSAESQPLVNSYDEAEAEQDAILTLIMYSQGFMDGVKSTKLLTRFGIIPKLLGTKEKATDKIMPSMKINME
jgi:hypothetical protein